MARRITVDPITRIEGHLRIDVEIAGGKVKDAWASGQMFRGIENILEGKDPNDAWFITQRFCGVCTTVHAIASVRAVENALGITIPLNAELVRNLILIAHGLHDHIVHFYHLSALDWVDVLSALKADPQKTAKLAQSLSDWPRNSQQEFAAVQARIKSFAEKGRLGIFANGYWGHPAMKLPPEVNLLAVAHYLQALEYQRYATQAYAILGGKNPHIQNLTVGGVMTAINPDDDSTLNMERLLFMKQLLTKSIDFVNRVYIPDVIAIAKFYPEWFEIGGGVPDYLAVPDLPLNTDHTRFDFPGGTILDGDIKSVRPIRNVNDPYFRDNVGESIAHAWYEGSWIRHPWEGATVADYQEINEHKSLSTQNYSWVKAPRFRVNGQWKPMQVGPAAQLLVGYARGDALTKKWVRGALQKLPARLQKPGILMSTLGRHLARAIRAGLLGDLALKHWQLLVDNIGKGDLSIATPIEYPQGEIRGVGFHEAPRGTLSHWIVVEKGKIRRYQAVVPSTWNAGPRDGKKQRGPYEQSLIDNPIADPEKPLEVLRTIHSFDPCLACAVHLFDPDGSQLSKVRVL